MVLEGSSLFTLLVLSIQTVTQATRAVPLSRFSSIDNELSKVNVTVYVESYCPCSGQWQFDFQKYIVNTSISNIVTLYRYWDGTAESNGNVTCFHGENECLANQLQNCVQNITNTTYGIDSWELWLNYTVCINGFCEPKEDLHYCETQYDIGTSKGLSIEQKCANIYGLNWNEINECSTSKQGLKMLWNSSKHGNMAGELYGIQGLPVVWVNGTRFSTFWDCNAYQTQMVPLVERICDVYQSINPGADLPQECEAVTKKVWH